MRETWVFSFFPNGGSAPQLSLETVGLAGQAEHQQFSRTFARNRFLLYRKQMASTRDGGTPSEHDNGP